MKKLNYVAVAILLSMPFMMTSCEVIGGIFKAGMGFGAFAVIAVIVLVIFLLTRMMGGGKK